MSLVNRTVLVTGASGGIGQAIARAFAARGAQVILSARRQDVLDSLAAQLGARAMACDLASREDVQRLLDSVGPVDVLIANAGLPATGHITDLSQTQLDVMLEVNLRAPIALARGLIPGMVERGRGHLVFVSSLSGKVASPVSSLYNATKFGLRGFSLAIREDLRGTGVGVSSILPGFISGAGMFADSQAQLPLGVGTKTPDDVASACVKAVERNRAEIAVAPVGLRVGAGFASVLPSVAANVTRLTGQDKVAHQLAAGQTAKRPAG
ncbi:MAG TPA: SDR family NAD(P)-dependent oxidoreductase [Solirubrobacteraceae bacterium]|jgi:short-subunit dehydrogenase|nr:SDR family NAD(P)-dependent oxidoreductase [Solirubrobacteraceae bacterium]